MLFKSDNGGEFKSSDNVSYLAEQLIQQQFTSPYNPHQNGIAERSNRTIAEGTVAMMLHAKAPNHLWTYAMNTRIYIENILPTNVFNNRSSPHHQLFNAIPNISHLRTWGCIAYALVPDSLRSSFGTRAIKGRFVGYEENSLAYTFYFTERKTFHKCGHMYFLKIYVRFHLMIFFNLPILRQFYMILKLFHRILFLRPRIYHLRLPQFHLHPIQLLNL
jgi:hypothetical protein